MAIQPNLRHLTLARQGYTSGAALFAVMLLYGKVGTGKLRVVELWECYKIQEVQGDAILGTEIASLNDDRCRTALLDG